MEDLEVSAMRSLMLSCAVQRRHSYVDTELQEKAEKLKSDLAEGKKHAEDIDRENRELKWRIEGLES